MKHPMRRLALPALASCFFAACAPAAAPTPDDPVQRLGLRLTFVDEFEGASVDTKRWNSGADSDPVDARSLYANSEHQVYLTPGYLAINEQPLSVANGTLTITAKPLTPAARSVVQAAVRALSPDKAGSALKDIGYGSGWVKTRGRFAQLYGYFEIRARVPEGKGLWPAFWLLPADGSWPPEIDVMEILGHDVTTVYQTLHSSAAPTQGAPVKVAPSADGFHRYGALWSAQTVDFYVDGAKVGSVPTPGDMHKPMYLVANLAVGGSWPGYPDATTRFPARMDIDYIRAWQFPKRPARP